MRYRSPLDGLRTFGARVGVHVCGQTAWTREPLRADVALMHFGLLLRLRTLRRAFRVAGRRACRIRRWRRAGHAASLSPAVRRSRSGVGHPRLRIRRRVLCRRLQGLVDRAIHVRACGRQAALRLVVVLLTVEDERRHNRRVARLTQARNAWARRLECVRWEPRGFSGHPRREL